MNQTEFLEEKRKVWAEQERHYGMLFDKDFREAVEEKSGPGLALYPSVEGLEDLRTSIPEFVETALILVNNRNDISGTNKVKLEKIRRKWFERRLRLVNLVSAKVISLENLIDRSFTPHKRIQWGPVCNEWNRKYPYDLMTPAVLKVEYYRAIAEADIQREYFNRRYREIELLHRESKKLLSNWQLQDPIVKLMARAMPLLRSGGQVASRIARGLGCLALRQPDIGSLISFFKMFNGLPDSDKEEIIKFLETELQAKGGTQ